MKSYRAWNPGQSFLLPPSPLEWLPEGHLAYFVLELVETIDLSAITKAIQAKDARGERPYPPAMLVALLLYGYAVGVFSSRKIERATYEDVAFRVLAGGAHPHFTTINEFRNTYRAEYSKVFKHVLRLCRAAGMVSLGHIAIDGTKVNANASKHKAMSYERMQVEEQRLSAEVEELLKKAEAIDRDEDRQYGVGKAAEDLPTELQFRETRLKRVKEAKAALEREAAETRAQTLRENAEGQREVAADRAVDAVERKKAATRAAKAEKHADELTKHDSDDEPKGGAGTGEGELPKHRVPVERDGSPKPNAQRNFTDPDSRIMMRNTEVTQAYNAQIAVDSSDQVIVAECVSNQSPDAEYFEPMLERVVSNCDGDAPVVVTADNGYLSKAAIDASRRCGVNAHISCGHGEKPRALVTREPETPAQKARAAMAKKLATPTGKAIYARRKAVAEPPFGQIKQARGFRRFSMRGVAKVRSEWTLVCLTHNVLKLFRKLGSLEILAFRVATS
jgi:transposase